MRKIIMFVLLTTSLTTYGQIQDSLKAEGTKVNHNEPFTLSGISYPLFFISLNDQVVEVKQGEVFSDSSRIDPSWILSVNVYKGQDALKRYGERAQYGAVLIDLKMESADKLPLELKKKFADSKN